MSHKRPWFRPVVGLAAFLAFLGSAPAIANCSGGGRGLSATEERLLTDFLILAVKPEGDDKDYKLIEVGKTKIDAGLLGVAINALPFEFLGLKLGSGDGDRSYNPAAEAAQCRAACAANEQCRSFAYVPPNARQQLGVCHLKTYADASVAVMTPGSGEHAPGPGTTIEVPTRDTAPSEDPPSYDANQPPGDGATDATIDANVAPPQPEAPIPSRPAKPREVVPPPPRLPPITVEPFPMPPRAVAEAPPRVIYSPSAQINPPPPLPVRIDQPLAPVETPPPATAAAEPTPAATPQRTRKPLPVWLAVTAIAFMLGGAGLYRHSHRKRVLARVTTRLVSNGLDRHTVAVQSAAQPDIGLRFVVRASAAVGASNTHIDLIPSGALA